MKQKERERERERGGGGGVAERERGNKEKERGLHWEVMSSHVTLSKQPPPPLKSPLTRLPSKALGSNLHFPLSFVQLLKQSSAHATAPSIPSACLGESFEPGAALMDRGRCTLASCHTTRTKVVPYVQYI